MPTHIKVLRVTDTALPDPQEFFKETATEVRFLDPVTSTELKADEPPPSLLEDPVASQGLAHLKKMAAEQGITVQLVQGEHGTVQDFYDMLEKSGDALIKAPIVAIEMDWRSLSGENQMPKFSSMEHILAENVGRRAFQNEQLSWLKKHDKVVLPCEYASENISKLAIRLSQLESLVNRAIDQKERRESTILVGSHQTTRQWIFLAQLGYWLQDLEEKKLLPQNPLIIPLMTGCGHKPLEFKLRDYFAIPTEKYFVPDRPLEGFHDDIFEDMTRYGRITYQQLETPFIFS